ncbi:MAG: LLM class flavin-dependent oxidoreductase [Chloroflexi bacterium]|nr:LLM class flavin-dependent oxidoreductase [Chloroflexota bacterium]
MVKLEFTKSPIDAAEGHQQCIRFAEEVEKLGYGGCWYPHMVIRDVPRIDTLTLMAAAAARTEKIRLGTSVLQVPLYPPVMLAQSLMTIDQISNGRLVLGVGIGWVPNEFHNVAVPFKERAGRTDEAIEIMKRLWTEEEVTFKGKYYDIREARMMAKPVQKPYPKIVIGGGFHRGARGNPDPAELRRTNLAEGVLRRIARFGDGWFPAHFTPETAAEYLPSAMERIRLMGMEYGRKITEEEFEIVLYAGGWVCVANSKEEAIEEARQTYRIHEASGYAQTMGNPSLETLTKDGALGTRDEVAEYVQSWVDVGKEVPALKTVVLLLGSLRSIEQLNRFHSDVRPLLRME